MSIQQAEPSKERDTQHSERRTFQWSNADDSGEEHRGRTGYADVCRHIRSKTEKT